MPFKLGIASVTLGRAAAGHSLPSKLRAAAEAGYDGIELTFECFSHYHTSLGRSDCAEDRLATARDVRKLASRLELVIISLQPFMNFDALRNCEARLEVGKEWVRMCAALGASWLQIPSAIYPLSNADTTSDLNLIAENVGRLADYAADFSVSLAYEAPSWGVALQTWQDIDQVMKLANRPNIQHCLDTFHVATHALYEPATLALLPDGDARLEQTLTELSAELKPRDIAYLQLSDGCSVDLTQAGYASVDLAQPAFCTWSRNARCHPYTHDGRLPIARILKAFLGTGFEGWVTMESFHPELWDKDSDVPKRWAEEGVRSWNRLKSECGVAE